jgi:hypothetical protein
MEKFDGSLKKTEKLPELSAVTFLLWCEFIYNKLVKVVGGDTAKFMKPEGNGKWREVDITKLAVITREIQQYILNNDHDRTIPLPSTPTTEGTASIEIPRSVSSELKAQVVLQTQTSVK